MATSVNLGFLRQIAAVAILTCGIFSGMTSLSLADGTLMFLGGDVRENEYYSYVGVRHHFSGDLTSDGVIMRATGLYAGYEYDTNAVTSGEVDADVVAFDALIGYQKGFENLTLRGFVGVDYEDHDLSPENLFDSNSGSDFGVKILGEIETVYASPYYLGLIGSYGSAKERYWSRLRVGHNFGGFIVGPEGILSGSQESDQQRIGAFATIMELGPFWVTASAGYSDTDENRGGSSPYGSIEFSLTF
jgi:hypothetical protein